MLNHWTIIFILVVMVATFAALFGVYYDKYKSKTLVKLGQRKARMGSFLIDDDTTFKILWMQPIFIPSESYLEDHFNVLRGLLAYSDNYKNNVGIKLQPIYIQIGRASCRERVLRLV